ncbi:MAG: NrtA/SsuA/CpmA family ABC transporter substrate-binding protein [Deltaproteobacteria bacterium]|nr:NrtA/SsuA/CpmA family ABC transporter substrate-binding protein [Deltaproteobacteria bacterium]
MRIIRFILAALLASFLVTGISVLPAFAAEKPKAIYITYVKAPLNIPSIVEKRMGLFEKEFGPDGIRVNHPEITSGSKQTEAIAAGSLDICNAIGGTSVILAAANGVDLKIIGIYSRAPKAFTIITKSPAIRTVADLKGKKIGGPKGTILHQLLLTALLKNNLKPDQIQYLSMDIAKATAALINGSIDAALCAGPDLLRAQAAGARILTTGEGLIEATITIAVRGEFLRQQPDLVRRFLKVHRESIALMKNQPQKAYEMTTEETGLPLEAVKQMAGWYDFDPRIKPSDIRELKETQDFLLGNGMLEKGVAVEGLIVRVE